MVEILFKIARGFSHRFPAGSDPFQIMTRLLEESGELAEQVNHFEGSGVKRQKHGEPDPQKLAKEVMDVMGTAAAVAVHYGIESEVETLLEACYQRLKSEGHIID